MDGVHYMRRTKNRSDSLHMRSEKGVEHLGWEAMSETAEQLIKMHIRPHL